MYTEECFAFTKVLLYRSWTVFREEPESFRTFWLFLGFSAKQVNIFIFMFKLMVYWEAQQVKYYSIQTLQWNRVDPSKPSKPVLLSLVLKPGQWSRVTTTRRHLLFSRDSMRAAIFQAAVCGWMEE